MRRDRDAIEELAALLDGRARRDEAAAPLRRLATLATAVADHADVPALDAAVRTRMRHEVVGAFGSAEPTLADRIRDTVDARTARLRYSVRAGLAAATASSMLASAGVAAAAQEALPGDLLYPVKQGTESVRLWLADGLAETGRLHLAFASERLEEVEGGVERLPADTLIDTLDEMDEESVLGANDLLEAYDASGDGELLTTLATFTEDQTGRLSAVAPLLPAEARSFVEQSFEVLRRIDVQVTTLVAAPCDACGTATASGGMLDTVSGLDLPLVTRPGEGPALGGSSSCGCVARQEPAPPRESSGPDPAPASPGGEEPAPSPQPEPTDDDDYIPELPDPLDPIGDRVDDLIDDIEDSIPPPPAPGLDEPGVDAVGETVDGADGDIVGPIVGGVGQTVDDVVDDVVGEVVDRLLPPGGAPLP